MTIRKRLRSTNPKPDSSKYPHDNTGITQLNTRAIGLLPGRRENPEITIQRGRRRH